MVRADEALLAMLMPLWQAIIGGFVLLAMLVAAARLSRRGPSRMGTALLVIGAAVVGLVVVGLMLA
jgi:lipopolysaccharide export LptBFGC system permease protein LptF